MTSHAPIAAGETVEVVFGPYLEWRGVVVEPEVEPGWTTVNFRGNHIDCPTAYLEVVSDAGH